MSRVSSLENTNHSLSNLEELGYGGEWEQVCLTDIYDIRSGLSKPRSEFGFGFEFLAFKDVFYNYVVPDALSSLVNSTEKEQASAGIKRGDVFLTRTSETMEDLGMSCVALKDYPNATFNGFTKRLRPKKVGIVIPEYAAYYFRSPRFRQSLTAMSSLSTRASLNNEMISRLVIKLPSLETQKAIGSILGTLDDKIELNRRMNETLEEMAHTLFKSWFVDFDPVRAKLDGRQPAGMDAETAALFPAEFQDSELGKIPKGWEVKNLDDLVDFVIGGDWGKAEPSEEFNSPVLCIRGADIPELQNYQLGKMPARYIKERSLEKRNLVDGDIVFEISGGSPTQSTGRPVLITSPFLKSIGQSVTCSNFCRLIRLTQPNAPAFLYFYLRYLYNRDIFLQYENGTTGIKNLAFKIFASTFPFVLPSDTVLTCFNTEVGKLMTMANSNSSQSRSLTSLRDTLLPKLLSGELRIKDAEKFVEDAV
jgi:type I restriction enzyme, S subunit